MEIIPVYERKHGIRIEMFGNKIERISEFDTVSGVILENKVSVTIFPASLYVTNDEKLKVSIDRIKEELDSRLKEFESEGKYAEKERLKQRTLYDIEMLSETGFCHGIENYSSHIALRDKEETPTTLMDFFPKDYLLVVDESHMTLPQVRGMFNGDRARKQTLVDYGFRLPSAL
ncbi:MAG: excinuclease ABC subunit B, partial [Cetobacterium sp.]